MEEESLQPLKKKGAHTSFTQAECDYNNAQIEKIITGDEAAEKEFRVRLLPWADNLAERTIIRVTGYADPDSAHDIAMDSLDATFRKLHEGKSPSEGWHKFSQFFANSVITKTKSPLRAAQQNSSIPLEEILDETHAGHPQTADDHQPNQIPTPSKEEYIAVLKGRMENPERAYNILVDYANGDTLEESGKKYGISHTRTWKIKNQAISIIQSHIHMFPDSISEFAIDQRPLKELKTINKRHARQKLDQEIYEQEKVEPDQKWVPKVEADKAEKQQEVDLQQLIYDVIQTKKRIKEIINSVPYGRSGRLATILSEKSSGASSEHALLALCDTDRVVFEPLEYALTPNAVDIIATAMTHRNPDSATGESHYPENAIYEFKAKVDHLRKLHDRWEEMGKPPLIHSFIKNRQ